MPNVVTEMLTRDLQESLGSAEGMIFVSYEGLSMSENEELRNEIATKSGAEFRMLRNKLAKRVLAERGIELSDDVLKGNVALASGTAEATLGAAKVLTTPKLKKSGKVIVKAGMLEGRVLGATDAAALADVPDQDTLRAMMLGVISGPARSLASVIAAPGSALARVIQAHADTGEDAS